MAKKYIVFSPDNQKHNYDHIEGYWLCNETEKQLKLEFLDVFDVYYKPRPKKIILRKDNKCKHFLREYPYNFFDVYLNRNGIPIRFSIINAEGIKKLNNIINENKL